MDFIFLGEVLQAESWLHGLGETGGGAGHRRVPVSVPAEEVELLLHAGGHQQPDQPDQGPPGRQEAEPVQPGGDAADWPAGPPQQLRLLPAVPDVALQDVLQGPPADHQRHVQLLHLQGGEERGQEQQEREETRQAEEEPERLVGSFHKMETRIIILFCLTKFNFKT